MAPSIISMHSSDTNRAGKELRKLRKPVIEKMRRDRINSSIEQLRILLEKDFKKQQLPSKPEKADILEMTVSFLQQHLAAKSAPSPSLSYREGHSRCLQESLHFLSLQPQSEAQVNLLHHIQGPHCALEVTHAPVLPSCDPNITQNLKGTKAVWRPW
ncbi:transcription factor HES-5-like [Bombina bombina]|uniref:transcription factor HES-5-like n=1 Tax=Bombina bombina TaxID=8345 RepID=UPI00235B080D|nr:transcription factor HES-5-like [Bombina bombina]